MEFRNSNEKGAVVKSTAPHLSFLSLLTSGCQEVVLIVGASDYRGRRNLGENPDDHSSQAGRPNVDEAVPTDPVRANPDPDDMDLGPNPDRRGEAPNLDRHPIDCC